MNRVEQILSKHLSDHAINGNVTDGATEITLEFTKWKDKEMKYTLERDGLYYEQLRITGGKTLDQLFNEWNNLNNK